MSHHTFLPRLDHGANGEAPLCSCCLRRNSPVCVQVSPDGKVEATLPAHGKVFDAEFLGARLCPHCIVKAMTVLVEILR